MNDRDFLFDDLPVHATSWDPGALDFPAEADFQSGIQEWVLQGELEEAPDAILGSRPAPRTWLLLYEPGEGRLGATAALALARELSGRDQAVLVLDCDDEDAVLTRWADRTDHEGWIDLIRYGASLLTCGERLPFAGRQGWLLGPGSYRPVDAQPEEIAQLLGRLRRQADDILLCCSIGDAGRAWAAQAEIRVLCWNAGRIDRAGVTGMAEGFVASGMPLTGVLRFGREEVLPAPLPGADEPAAETAPDPVDEAPAVPVPDREPEPLDAAQPADGIAPPEKPGRADNWEDRRGPAPVEAAPDLYARKRGTSRLFWWIAAGAVVLILGSIWYYREYVMISPLDADLQVALNDPPAETISEPVVAEIPAAGDSARDEAPADPAGDLVTETTTSADSTGVEAAGDAGIAEQTPPPPTEPEPGTAAAGETPPPAQADAAEFYMDPYLVPVGSDGWALHIYSFPDEETAAQQLAELKRRGFQTEIRTVQIKDKGRWQRIFLGSFPDKASANEALGPLLKELGEDWGRPTKF